MTEFEPTKFSIRNRIFDDASIYKDENIKVVELKTKDISEFDFLISDIPLNTNLSILLENNIYSQEIPNIDYNAFELKIIDGETRILIMLSKYFDDSYNNWGLTWDIKKFFDCVKTNLKHSNDFQLYQDNSYEQAVEYEIIYNGQNNISIFEQYINAIQLLDKLFCLVKIDLGGIKLDKTHLMDEKRFSLAIVEPLLRLLKFNSVRYNHGTKEFGKDFICNYKDNFNIIRYIGIQVKVGNISGKVNSEIDEILGQINDAFSMPFKEIGDKSEKYISTFFVITNGLFTDNAQEKITEKIPKNLIGNITFIDRNAIQDLLDRHRNK